MPYLAVGLLMLAVLLAGLKACAHEVTPVRDGKINAVVVTAVDPTPVAAYAAQELIDHIEKATGTRLPLAMEASIPSGYASHIFVGATEAARQQGIDPDQLEIENSVLRTVGDDLYIVGKELRRDQYHGSRPHGEPWNPLSNECVHSGTLFGVYDVLDRYLGVRWLWPGELGTYVPRTNTVKIPELDETVKPKLLYRDLGGWELQQMFVTGSYYGRKVPRSYKYGNLTEEVARNLVFPDDDAAYAYGRAMDIFSRRHRRVTPIDPQAVRVPRAAHQVAGIDDWWARYGKEHPDWFAMRADGGRGMKEPRAGAYTALCISNPELHRFIAEKAWDGGDVLPLGEADASDEGLCHCPNCLAWDGPQPTEVPEIVRFAYMPRAMGDRYARYWKTIYDLAVKRNSNVKVTAYLYFNTLPAPLTDIKLNPNIYGEFVIYGSWAGWYPMSNEEDQWYRDQWLGWGKTGMTLFDRSNYLLNNYVTPNVTTWQSGEFLHFAYQHSLIGIAHESYTFSWAAHGPMAYMHYRFLDRPEMTVAQVRKEYFSAFGPAAQLVEKYFDYWESYARTRPSISSISSGDVDGALEKLRRPRGHYLAYPPQAYAPAQAILDEALDAARKDPLPEFAERVEFLQAGLRHALLTTRVYEFLDYDSPSAQSGSAPSSNPEKLKQAREATQAIIAFRQDPANRFVSDYMSNAVVETYYIRNIAELFKRP